MKKAVDAHIHTHRNLIGFDERGIPVITHHSDHETEADFIKDYMQAVQAYKKSFPDKKKVMEETPDPAVREMLQYAEEKGINTAFDRFDSQKPHCSFGLAGICCKVCHMGPCRITERSPRGTCGADADLIVARNLLRMAAAGAAQHGMHAREVILSLKWAAEGKLDLPLLGEQKIRDTAAAFGIQTKNRQLKHIASDLADAMLEDISRGTPDRYRTIDAVAHPERRKVWEELDILPISAYHEVFESFHKSGCATDSDWKSIMAQFLRVGLAFTFSGVVGSSIATDCLFGVGDFMTAKTNLGALDEDYVNIAVHGHLPTLVSQIVKIGNSEEMQEKARAQGAKGIKFYGICCSGLSMLYRNENVIPLSNAVTAELVLATGGLDLWVADVQDVYPGIMEVAECFKTPVVTTSESARLPGAIRMEYDHHHSNIGQTKELATKIVELGIDSFGKRREVPRHIPEHEVEAEVGFSVESLSHRFGSLEPIAEALKSGEILGIVNLVGCNNPKVVYEKPIVDVARVLIENNVLVLTNGCASYPLMKLGYCQKDSWDKAGENLKNFLKPENLPPVWHVGECIDNTRSSSIFGGIAKILGHTLPELPLAFSSPEWSNEKSVDAALAFRLNGMNSYHCVEAPIYGSKNVIDFLKDGTKETLGSVMVVDPDAEALGLRIVEDLKEKRRQLGWTAE